MAWYVVTYRDKFIFTLPQNMETLHNYQYLLHSCKNRLKHNYTGFT